MSSLSVQPVSVFDAGTCLSMSEDVTEGTLASHN